MTRRFCLIANPSAGPGPATHAVGPIADSLQAAGADVDVVISDSIGSSRTAVEKAVADDRVVVAVGGDGMVGSVVGVVGALDGVLGIVPAGSGNDLARTLDLPNDVDGIVGVLLHGTPREVDLIAYTAPGHERRVVACSVYAGMDARNSELANSLDWAPRERKYEFAAIANLVHYEADDFEVTVDGVTTRHRGADVVVANSAYYGAGIPVAPDADVTDGVLDIIVAEAPGRRAWMETLLAASTGAHVERPDVQVFRGRSVALRGRASDRTQVPAGGDGEQLPPLPLLDADPAVIEVLPAAVKVLVKKVSR